MSVLSNVYLYADRHIDRVHVSLGLALMWLNRKLIMF